ncbi:MAG: hypothetical protein JXA25_12120, partial [Anaerolineales bacterium]|nr:hypothetical protein [Anaerolineales bacterium]
VHLFGEGKIQTILDDMEFSPAMRDELVGISAVNWTDFAVQAYRIVKAADAATEQHIALPSPLEGLTRGTSWSDQEQVA